MKWCKCLMAALLAAALVEGLSAGVHDALRQGRDAVPRVSPERDARGVAPVLTHVLRAVLLPVGLNQVGLSDVPAPVLVVDPPGGSYAPVFDFSDDFLIERALDE